MNEVMKKYLIFGDCHLEKMREVDNSYLLFKEVVKKTRPNVIVCLGDLLDFGYISHYAELGETEGKRLSDDINTFKEELMFFKKYSKERAIFLQGNHEDRLYKLLNKNPVLIGMVDLESICNQIGVEYVPTVKQPFKLLDDLYVAHGLTYTKQFCAKLADSVGCSIVQGHTHRTQQFVQTYPDGRIIKSFGLGSLTDTIEYYEKGKRMTGHSNSFGELILLDNQWQLNTIMIENNKCIMDGKLYTLENVTN